MSSAYPPEAMKKRFWELFDQKEEVDKDLAPLRKKRDDMRDALRGPVAEHKAAQQAVLKVERVRTVKIDMEMAVLARALGNNPGARNG